ncbi:hypothetical protein HYALB_00011565 [Hymenoscyphus albidus]|uniref:Mitochondrial ATPase complex subunit ATP10 n=1 Tax=Hymenoscyphus albidus TaxID=595503 RepID=A0A9N9LK34_9HELO|nr:hypothetical protein HYALB_00011565 [Hymenoscyphus albidus]
MIVFRTSFRTAKYGIDAATCMGCQWRAFGTSYRQFAAKRAPKPKSVAPAPAPAPTPAEKASPSIPSPLEDAPRAYGKSLDEFVPKPLLRPIGIPYPPQPGQNSGIDTRSIKQRRDDFVDYNKHLARRKELTHKVASPYFREWSNMRFSKGKTFVAPPRIFKSQFSLYFPNLQGQTLLPDKLVKDTTPILAKKISVVTIFNTRWAENQTATFTSEKNNPQLHELLKSNEGIAQTVQINMEDNWMKAWLVRLFMPSLRKTMPKANWGRYFLVRRGFTQELQELIGLLNTKVGYTYVLDGECKIRWAGSGLSEGDEKEGLVKAVAQLVQEARKGPVSIPKPIIDAPKPNKKAAIPAV